MVSFDQAATFLSYYSLLKRRKLGVYWGVLGFTQTTISYWLVGFGVKRWVWDEDASYA